MVVYSRQCAITVSRARLPVCNNDSNNVTLPGHHIDGGIFSSTVSRTRLPLYNNRNGIKVTVCQDIILMVAYSRQPYHVQDYHYIIIVIVLKSLFARTSY